MSTSNGLLEPKSSLPTFTSISDQPNREFSHAGSSNASSSRSATRSRTRSNNGNDDRQSPSVSVREESIQRENAPYSVSGTVKRAKRSSGGFLLDSSPTSSRLSRSILNRRSLKGKERHEESPLSVAKIRRLDNQGSSSSVRGSLLSSDIRSSPAENNNDGSRQSSRNAAGSSNHSQKSSNKADVPSFGFDTDPAQIVDMALRLNEGRKRQVSGKRFVSAGTPSKRVVSGAPSSLRSSPPNRPLQNGSVKPTPRKTLNPEPATPPRPDREVALHTVETTPRDAFSPEQDEDDEQDMQISRATQNRVAKAKAYFELAYQHRRLLSHLPPVRTPDAYFNPENPGYDSKVYNPLQYARNRKLRFRERHSFNAEVEGWHDLEKIRPWVDAVVSSHPETHHDPRQCIRLPPLTLVEAEAKDSDDDENDKTRAHMHHGRPRRPKSDWVTHPGDLIADAFWTEQGLNKQKIYNRDNEPVYPPGTKFMFSGWRNRTPLNVPEELKASSPEVSPTANKKMIDSPPDLPAFESAHKDHTWERARSKFGKTLKKRSKKDKNQKTNIFDTSSESSDSNTSSGEDKQRRGRKRPDKDQKLALSDGDPFAKPVQPAQRGQSTKSNEVDPTSQGAHRNSVDHASLLKYLQRSNTSTTAFTDDTDQSKTSKRRKLLETIRLDSDYAGRSSFEYDSTAPGTPVAHGFPSIAINLSPPNSRSPSPSRRGSNSFLGAIKDKSLDAVNLGDRKDHIDRTDFARMTSHRPSRSRSSFARSKNHSRSTSPMTRGISPTTRQKKASVDESFAFPAEHRGSNISKVSSRTNESHRHHRVRGIFKGGRIAELVGNEVSRVGDYIWKREPPRTNVMDGGSISGYETDSDEFSDSAEKPVKKIPDRDARLSLTNSHTSGRSPSPTSKSPKLAQPSAQQFHIQGLPSFTSPFQRDREDQQKKNEAQSPGGTPVKTEDDNAEPVSTGAAQRPGRSPRFDRLAPPKLDIRAATPDGRRNSYGFGVALDMTRTLSASETYNSAINGEARRPREGRLSSVALSRPYYKDSANTSQNDLALTRTQSMAPKHVTVHDFARVRGLLASVAVKATNMAKYCDEIPRPQSDFLYSAFETTRASGSEIDKHLPIPRKQEHVVAARHLIEHLNTQSSGFNDRLTHFTSTTMVNLQREMQILEDKTESSLFPRLQRLSDEAGQLAQKLTTTSTLAVRSVNDEVVEAARLRRRGPYRLSRALWFKLIEWGVVGLLWGIWFVVKIIRVVVGLTKGFWTLIAWLLWLQ